MKYSPFKTQPQSPTTVDKNHWLAQRFTSAYVPAIYGGNDVLNRSIPMSTWANLSVVPRGDGLKALGEASGNFYHANKAVDVPTAFPVVQLTYGYFNSSADTWVLASMVQSAVGTSGESCNIALSSGTQIAYSFRTAFGATATVTMSPGTTNTGTLFCCMSQSLSATDHRFYINGVKGSSSTNTGTPTNKYDRFSIGGASFKNLNGGIIYNAYGHKAFTDEECLKITKDPTLFWGMFNNYEELLPLVADSNTTTTQTITGVARIQATTTKTETGVSRIQKSVSQTEIGVSRIQVVVNQTETGIARVQSIVNQTESGVSRITATTTQTITGVANITSGNTTTTQTIDGTARITATTTKTETGVARIENTVTQTVTGVSRIGLVTTKTETGVSRITVSTTRTETGLARITATTNKTITGVARIAGSGASLSPLSYISVELGGGVEKSISAQGNLLEIEVVTSIPSSAPANNKGMVVYISGSTVTLYVWNGSTWLAK